MQLGSHPANQQKWWVDYKDMLTSIDSKIKAAGMRVSMHPGQYTILNSPDGKVLEQAVNDLVYHARLLDGLGVDSSHKIVLHVGGVYEDKTKAVQRFVENYNKIPDNIKD